MGAPKGNQYALGNNGGHPMKFKTVEELQKKIDAYFESCWQDIIVRDKIGNVAFDADGQPIRDRQQVAPYTVSGLAVYLETTRETLLDYENVYKEFSSTIKKAKEKIKAYTEAALFTIKNPAGAIFNLKANWGFQDTQKVDVNLTTLAATLKDLE